MNIKWFLLLMVICASCNKKKNVPLPDIKFERAKWEIKGELNYTYRKQMINDLLTNYQWPGLKKDSVLKILGNPDGIEEDVFMLYHYDQKYIGSFVLSTKSFVVQLAPDSTVVMARTN